jgi:FtsP/CotA-like multicopper oxidase with cupredoxin domain
VIEAGTPQPVKIVAIDGVPTTGEPQPETSIVLPPGARAEFVVETPKAGEPAQLVTTEWDTGPQGDRDPTRPIANIVSSDDAVEPPATDVRSDSAATWRPESPQRAIVQRRLYFSQMVPNPKEGDTSVFYFITVSGQQPAAYRMDQPPSIVLHAGDVEDWIVENRAPEEHVFHIHQIHFRVLEVDGKPVHENALRDTVDIPYWSGEGPYHSVKLRMDFRDPDVEGTFLYHCHILKHEDMGMMGVIQVLPPGLPTAIALQGPSRIGVATLATITASVTPNAATSTVLGGTVQFAIDGITTGQPAKIVDGKATFTTSFDAGGEHLITAVYAGDPTFDVSASRPLKLKVTE